jgi:uncharacterized protein YheU (UPF0270 family)
MIEIPYTSLSPEALHGVLEEFVTRESTEYGMESFDLSTKIAQVKAQLVKGKARIVFDEESETCQLLLR